MDCARYEQTLEDCLAERSGYNGYTIVGGFARLTNCTGSLNGTHYVAANPVATAGWGYTLDASSIISAIRNFSGGSNTAGLGEPASGSISPRPLPPTNLGGGADLSGGRIVLSKSRGRV